MMMISEVISQQNNEIHGSSINLQVKYDVLLLTYATFCMQRRVKNEILHLLHFITLVNELIKCDNA